MIRCYLFNWNPECGLYTFGTLVFHAWFEDGKAAGSFPDAVRQCLRYDGSWSSQVNRYIMNRLKRDVVELVINSPD